MQHALIALLDKLRLALENKGYGGAILMELSKTFDTLNHDLLITKLHAYGFSKTVLFLIKSYSSNRWQRTKINNSYSFRTELPLGVPQGSILGPLLFNINLNNLSFLALDTGICNIADDNTLYTCDISLSDVISKLESSENLVFDWFWYCHLLVCGIKEEVVIVNIGNSSIMETHEVKLLVVSIDRKLKYKKNVQSIHSKAGKK